MQSIFLKSNQNENHYLKIRNVLTKIRWVSFTLNPTYGNLTLKVDLIEVSDLLENIVRVR